jgi:hypothetical protein
MPLPEMQRIAVGPQYQPKRRTKEMKTIGPRTMKWAVGVLGVLLIAGYAVRTWANPAVGVTATLIGRGTYKKFQIVANPQNQTSGSADQPIFEYAAQAQPAIDMIVQTHNYLPNSSTGWHTHPGPVYITVTQGALAFYEVDDPTCSPHVVTAGQGYLDTGHGHIGLNQTGNPAQDVTVAIAPVGGAFRSELPAPGPYCSF